MRVNKNYILAIELANPVKYKNDKYILETRLFKSQYNKLKNHKDKIKSFLDEITGSENSSEIIFDKRVNF
ncbi:hypothetical protein ES702_04063 [subsurface metagenome]